MTAPNTPFNFDTTYTSLAPHFFAEAAPDSVAAPQLVIVNHALAAQLGVDLSGLSIDQQAALFSGNQVPMGASPLAQAYAGHQFGNFTILGDGRAHLLGEHVTPNGDRFDIQFKGSGRTPFSRGGDGKAALGPMLREFIISEALYHLGIPTTRSLAVVATGEPVMRDAVLPGAILTRVAASHIRFGTFQFAAHHGDKAGLDGLLAYTIARHYPDLEESPNKALALLAAVMERQADLIVHWMRVGFIHGVMNTDNMTLSGEAIDFGPCAFMDAFDPQTVFSSIDHMGRYAYGNQPKIALWNLTRLAETLLPLIDDDTAQAVKLAESELNKFAPLYEQKWLTMMRHKLGLDGAQEGDAKLITDLLDWMQKHGADYTNSFYDLTYDNLLGAEIYQSKPFTDWHQQWTQRRDQNQQPADAAHHMMARNNPVLIPRNHNVEQALSAANEGDLNPLQNLLAALEEPYADKAEFAPYKSPPAPSERVYQTFCGT